MAKIIPKLNLNGHYRDSEHNSIVDATNIMVSDDYFTLQTEVGTKINDVIINHIRKTIDNNDFDDYDYEIIHITPCNKELILFVKLIDVNQNNTIDINKNIFIFRYNEDENKICNIVNDFNYNGGKLISTFTYNVNDLIIAISEINDDISSPLKVLNLGSFDSDVTYLRNNNLHSISPVIYIPKVITKLEQGFNYKGWYYIFIRYKLDNNNYTQWFNTNESIYLDTFSKNIVVDYYISDEYKPKKEDENGFNGRYSTLISDNKDYCNVGFSCTFENIDEHNYKYYQLGFICISKTYTKCFISNDIDTRDNNNTTNTGKFIFNNSVVKEYSALELIKNYTNYYNVKTIENYNNRLYISNYEESNSVVNEEFIKNTTIELTLMTEDVVIDSVDEVSLTEKQLIVYDTDYNNNGANIIYKSIVNNIDNKDYISFNDLLFRKYDKSDSSRRFTNYNGIVTLSYRCDYIDSVDGSSSVDYIDVEYDSNTICGVLIYTNNVLSNIDINKIDVTNNEIITIPSDLNGRYGTYKLNRYKIDGDYYYLSMQSFINDNQIKIIETIKQKININSNINQLNNIGILPNNYYNFYIHFIDKYGALTKGIQIKEFIKTDENGNYNIDYCDTAINLSGNLIIKPNVEWVVDVNENNKKIYKQSYIDFILNNPPSNYNGFCISYEKLEKSTLYTAIANNINDSDVKDNNIKLYNDRFNYEDNINIDFNELDVYYSTFSNSDSTKDFENYDHVNTNKTLTNIFTKLKPISNIFVSVADSFNNIFRSTNINFTYDIINENNIEDKNIENHIVVVKKTDNVNQLYTKEEKVLIPCTQIYYYGKDTNEISGIINTKNSFITIQHALVYNDVFYNNATKVFQENDSAYANRKPFKCYTWYYWDDVLHESIQFNNEPVVTAFPINGLNKEEPYEKSFHYGYIVEAKNTIDLYQQKQVAIYDLYPKSLEYYNKNIKNITKFSNIIRRSNIIQDESDVIGWRYFETDNYTIINENKGSIIKLTGIGNNLIVHTEHSLFLFDSNNSLKTDKDENVQLASIDIWDIKYKEVLTSKLGYAGLNKEHHAIVGEFGYIFYSQDDGKYYRFDNGNLKRIDEKITLYTSSLKGKDVHFTDDKENSRLLISIDNTHLLSYHYVINDFISTHTYNFNRGYTTKNKTYLISNDCKNVINYYNKVDDSTLFCSDRYNYNGLNTEAQYSSISILCNIDYETIKYLNAIKYKLYKIIGYGKTNVNKLNFCGESIKIYSEYGDTGYLDLGNHTFTFNSSEIINKFNDFEHPYFRLGNWHFNYIRDKIKQYIDHNAGTDPDNMAMLYGNYFIIKFTFSDNSLIEIDSINYKINKDLIE